MRLTSVTLLILLHLSSSFRVMRTILLNASKFKVGYPVLILHARTKATTSIDVTKAKKETKVKPAVAKKSSPTPLPVLNNTKSEVIEKKFEPHNISFVVNMEPRPLMRHMSRRGFMYNPSAPLQKAFLADCQPFLPPSPLDGPLELELYFYFRRPLSHYRTGQFKDILKDSSPLYHTGRRDIDNLVKFVLDALNKVAYSDDSQVCMLKSGKFYTSEEPRVEVIIRTLDPDHR